MLPGGAGNSHGKVDRKERSPRVGPGKGRRGGPQLSPVLAMAVVGARDSVPCFQSLPGESFSSLRMWEAVGSALSCTLFAEEMRLREVR